ncbi:hypothetical protein L1887_62864 [Cichorium endivia]|nr:hypothetical protein L1887_62864 [Cichorium endivia]
MSIESAHSTLVCDCCVIETLLAQALHRPLPQRGSSAGRVRVERQAVALHRSRASCRRGADRIRVLRAATGEILHAGQLDSASAGSRHPPIQLPPLFCPRLRTRTRTRTCTCVRTRAFVFACLPPPVRTLFILPQSAAISLST